MPSASVPPATPPGPPAADRRVRVVILVAAVFGAVGLVALVGLRSTFHTWRVPAESMYPALQAGDFVVGAHWDPAARAERGRIVIFRSPDNLRVQFLKRVVAVAGDEVELTGSGDLLINGAAVPRCELGPWPEDPGRELLPAVASLEGTGGNGRVVLWSRAGRTAVRARVPEDHVYVLGDNRDNSSDSRSFGPVPLASVDAVAVSLFVTGETKALWEGRRGRDLDTAYVPPALAEALDRCRAGF